MIQNVFSWFPTILCVSATLWRTLNLGYQPQSYLVSALGQLLLLLQDSAFTKYTVLNGFYLISALVGWWRWSAKEK